MGLRLITKAESGALRAAVLMNFDYLNTTASIADSRTSTMNAVLAAAAPGVFGENTVVKGGEEEIAGQGGDCKDVSVLYLIDFGTGG